MYQCVEVRIQPQVSVLRCPLSCDLRPGPGIHCLGYSGWLGSMRFLPVSTHPHGSRIRSTHPTFFYVSSGDGPQVLMLAQKALYQRTVDPTEPRHLAPAETKGRPWGQLPFSREGTTSKGVTSRQGSFLLWSSWACAQLQITATWRGFRAPPVPTLALSTGR